MTTETRGMRIGPDGRLAGAIFVPSPHFDERPEGAIPSLVVIHAISLPPGEFGGGDVERLFMGRIDPAAHPYYERLRGLKVSAHFFIRRDGTVLQFVPCEKRAWHAGASCWRGRERVNDFSIGIEIEGSDELPFEKAQYERLAALMAILQKTYPIEAAAGHSDVAPGRKTDPGPRFDWRLLDRLMRDSVALMQRD